MKRLPQINDWGHKIKFFAHFFAEWLICKKSLLKFSQASVTFAPQKKVLP